MPTVVLSPIGGAAQQFFDNSGNVLAGGKMYTYAAGTTTPLTTYTNSTGTVANTNPIVLNSAGRAPNEIWLVYQTAYKLVLKDANDVLIYTWDNVSNDYVFPAVLPIASGQNLTNLNGGQIVSGTVPWARLPFTPIAATEKAAVNGVATLDSAGGLVQAPGVGSVLTASLAANAVTQIVTSTLSTASALTTSTTYVDVGTWSASITTTGGPLIVFFSGGLVRSDSNSTGWLAAQANGVDYLASQWRISSAGTAYSTMTGIAYIPPLPAGTYTIKARFKSSSATNGVGVDGTNPNENRMTIIELKK